MLLSGPDVWSCSSHSVDMREYIAHTLEVAEKEPRKPRSLMTLLAIKQLPLDFVLSEILCCYNLMLVRFSVTCSCMHPDTDILHEQDEVGDLKMSQAPLT